VARFRRQRHPHRQPVADACRPGPGQRARAQPGCRAGALASTTAALLIDPFCAAHPLTRVSLGTSLRSAQVIDLLRRFELDAGIIYLEGQDTDGLRVTPLYTERQVLDEALSGHGLALTPQLETDSVAALYAQIATGRWASIVPYPWTRTVRPPLGTRILRLHDRLRP
jgi:DNA-binding transcriptional LysR family regulator